MKQHSKQKSSRIFNREILLYAVVSLVLLLSSLSFFSANEREIALFLLIPAIPIGAGVFLTPLYFSFSDKALTAVWLLSFRKTIFWSAINHISEEKFLFSSDHTSKYVIMYRCLVHKASAVREFSLPRNKRTRRFVEKYAKNKIL